MKGGFGGTDIYMCLRKGDKWSAPINLGEKINTSGNETYPMILDEGYLFFSSDTHLGMGGYDIFVSQLTSTGFSDPLNLKYPINSPADDYSLCFDKNNTKSWYFSSNRKGGKGGDDIYHFTADDILSFFYK
jgi:hypothetical protein